MAILKQYYIDYEKGTIPISDLPIGSRVVDPTWVWKFCTDLDYSGDGVIKPVLWLVVSNNHYENLGPHVTLLTEELIGMFPFDCSSDSNHKWAEYGYNHWGDSGTFDTQYYGIPYANSYGLRPWLNSNGAHKGEGFYDAFSVGFKRIVLSTTLPNKVFNDGECYTTSDWVFIPSTTELGDSEHIDTYQIGKPYLYFENADFPKRIASIGGKHGHYWTRSPDNSNGSILRSVDCFGYFYFYSANYFPDGRVRAHLGVRPALNIKAETLISEIET